MWVVMRLWMPAQGRSMHGALRGGLVQVMPGEVVRTGVARESAGREDPLPVPVAARVGELWIEGVRKRDTAVATCEICSV